MTTEATQWIVGHDESPFRIVAAREAALARRMAAQRTRDENRMRNARAQEFTTLEFQGQLRQDEFWETRSGRVMVIADMVPDHAANALRMIGRDYKSHAAAASLVALRNRDSSTAMAIAGDPEKWFTTQPQVLALLARAQEA